MASSNVNKASKFVQNLKKTSKNPQKPPKKPKKAIAKNIFLSLGKRDKLW
jgi:hypothetical protein